MQMTKQSKRPYLRYSDLNSMIISGNTPPLESNTFMPDVYSHKVKQIKFLRRFQQLFRKEYLQNRKNAIEQSHRSNFQVNNRLKGMFTIKKRNQYSENRIKKQTIGDDDVDEQDNNPPVQGKSFIIPKPKVNRQSIEKKQLSWIKTDKAISNKDYSQTLTTFKRSSTRNQQISTIMKIFNTDNLITLIQRVNKISICSSIASSKIFTYFGVYIQEGNNGEMIKAIVRKRPGWRVVETPAVANMVWSQFYKISYDIKLNKKIKDTENGKHSLKKYEIPNALATIAVSGKTQQANSPLKQKISINVRKSQSINPNALSTEQYNKQVRKICPHSEHLSRQPTQTNNSGLTYTFYNHIPNHHQISDKKYLLENMKVFYKSQNRDVFQVVPYSIQISQEQIGQLKEEIKDSEDYWIVKPGENSNRGRGIFVTKGIQSVIKQLKLRRKKVTESCQKKQQETKNKNHKSLIIQKYLPPLLYNKRKFDIRMFMLVTLTNKKLRGYIYEQGYVRTSCKNFTYDNFSKYIHLTNDAVQSRSGDYGKYQEGNKLSWKKFQNWLIQEGYPNFHTQFQARTKNICKDILKSVQSKFVNGYQKKYLQTKKQKVKESSQHESNRGNKIHYQIFGLDFFIDEEMKTWLIEVNTNPALTTDCSRVVHTLIPKMIDNAFTIAVEPYVKVNKQSDTFKFQNKFSAIYDDEWKH